MIKQVLPKTGFTSLTGCTKNRFCQKQDLPVYHVPIIYLLALGRVKQYAGTLWKLLNVLVLDTKPGDHGLILLKLPKNLKTKEIGTAGKF